MKQIKEIQCAFCWSFSQLSHFVYKIDTDTVPQQVFTVCSDICITVQMVKFTVFWDVALNNSEKQGHSIFYSAASHPRRISL